MIRHWMTAWHSWYRMWWPRLTRQDHHTMTTTAESRSVYASQTGICLSCDGFGITNDGVCDVCGGTGRQIAFEERREPVEMLPPAPLEVQAQSRLPTHDSAPLPADGPSSPPPMAAALQAALVKRDAIAIERDQACSALRDALQALREIEGERDRAEARVSALESVVRQAEAERAGALDTARKAEQEKQAWQLAYQYARTAYERLRQAAGAVMPSDEELDFFAGMLDHGAEGVDPETIEQWQKWLALHAVISPVAAERQEDLNSMLSQSASRDGPESSAITP